MISKRKLYAADLFCGSGGTSYGFMQACEQLGVTPKLTAINHWPTAIETHRRSHPEVHHMCENLDNVDPRKVFPGGKLDMLVASPECTHFSIARGGKPKNDQSRASGWHVLRWAEALRPDAIVVENVKEWQNWAPLADDGVTIDPNHEAGETFRGWIAALEGLGYVVDHKVLCCADYGDVTSRQRLFVMARRDGNPIKWPEQTHAKEPDMFVKKKWRGAKEIIDWENEGTSIFNRSKPLSPNTMKRIMAGIEKFCPEVNEFLVKINGNDAESIKHSPKSVEEPLRTITAGGKHFALVKTNFLVQMSGTSEQALNNTAQSVENPLTTIHGGKKHGLVELEPLVVQIDNHSSKGHNCRTTDQPISTVVTKGRHCLVQPFLTKYYGNEEGAQSIDEPVHTLTTKGRHALVTPTTDEGMLDIKFRMLTNEELAAAHGMEEFKFAGTGAEVTKQIGNSVPCNTAKALCLSQLCH